MLAGNVMEKFTITQLKKQLAQKTKAELIQEISTLCQKIPQVKEYYSIQNNDTQDVVKKYQEIIEKEFIDGKTRGFFPKARFSVARKAVTDFKKLADDPALIVQVMLTYVESISRFNSRYAPDTEELYTRPEDMFENVLALIAKHHLKEVFYERAYAIVEHACEGFGHRDCLQEHYEEVYREFVE